MKSLAMLALSGLIFLNPSAQADTFVGNGGNTGDIELQVTIKELQETLRSIIENKTDSDQHLCTCNEEMEGHGSCETLKALTQPQVTYCAQMLSQKAPEMRELLKSGHVHFNWTVQDIEVHEDSGPRGADAVTEPANSQITLNQNRFLAMKSFERVLLVGHELFHLVQNEGKTIRDDQPIGPFTDPEGGRTFLNSIGAALTMQAVAVGSIAKYQSALTRSRGRKPFWIYLSTQKQDSHYSNEIFKVEKNSGYKLGVRYDFSNWGVYGEFRSGHGSDSFLSVIKVNEDQTAMGLGLSWRFFPSSDPLTFWGQSYILLKAGAEIQNSKYEVQDGFDDVTSSASSTSWSAGGAYFMPLRDNFWIYLQLGYSGHRYHYDLNEFATVDYNRTQTNSELGVSYGF